MYITVVLSHIDVHKNVVVVEVQSRTPHTCKSLIWSQVSWYVVVLLSPTTSNSVVRQLWIVIESLSCRNCDEQIAGWTDRITTVFEGDQ